MSRNAEETRQNVLGAAADEFAEKGFSGARIDSIASNAGISKPMIYAYFGDKRQLFDAVFEREILAASKIVAFDATDLAGYAARTYDLYVDRPRLWRLLVWARLERGVDVLLLAAGAESRAQKERELSAAQAAGLVNDSVPPFDLIRLVTAISQMWCLTDLASTPAEHRARRKVIHEAVGQLAAPKVSPSRP